MDATLILIDSDAELSRARALIDRLWNSNNPTDIVRLRGKKGLSMAMVRLRARFRVPADLLVPPPKKSPSRRRK